MSEEDGLFTASTGVVLRLRTVPIHILTTIRRQVDDSEPRPPRVFIKEKEREEENPNDPDYQRALQEHAVTLQDRITNALLLLGTAVETIPDGFEEYEGSVWPLALSTLGIEVATNSNLRYLDWLKLYAVPTVDDWTTLIEQLGAMTGVQEGQVADAVQGFPGDTPRGADNGNRAERRRSDRDKLRKAPL